MGRRKLRAGDVDPNPCVVGAAALVGEALWGQRYGETELRDELGCGHELLMWSPGKPPAHALVMAAAVLLRRATDSDHARLPLAHARQLADAAEALAKRRPTIGALRGVHAVATGRVSLPRSGPHRMRLYREQQRLFDRVNLAVDAELVRLVSERFTVRAELTERGVELAQRAGWVPAGVPNPGGLAALDLDRDGGQSSAS